MNKTIVAVVCGAAIPILLAFTPHPVIWVAVILWCLLLAFLMFVEGTPQDRSVILRQLHKRDNASLYTFLVDRILAGLTRMMLPKKVEDDPQKPTGRINAIFWYLDPRAVDAADQKRLQGSAWSWPVMDTALKLAIIYPLWLLLLQWAVTGNDTGIAGATVIGAAANPWLRLATIGLLSLYLASRILASASQMRVFEKASDWLFFVAFAVAVAGAFAGAFAGAVAVAGAVAAAVAGAFAGAVAFAGAGAVAVAVSYVCTKGRGTIGYALLVAIAIASVTVALILSPASQPVDLRPFAFAIGLLPVLNALFDYLSYGLTLTLIAKGRKRRSIRILVYGVIDAVCAIFILIGLGLTITGFVALINALSVTPLFDLPTVFRDLSDPATRGSYTWLYLTLFSTLIPTVVHIAIGLLSAFTWVPQHYKSWLANQLGDGNNSGLKPLGGSIIGASAGLVYAGVVAGGLTALAWVFLNHAETLGMALLEVIRTLSDILGLI